MPAAPSAASVMSRYSATTAAVTLPPIGHHKEPLPPLASAKQPLPSSDNTTDPNTFLSTLHTHIQHSQALHSALHRHTTATLADLTSHLTSQHRRPATAQHNSTASQRASIRESQQDDHQWRIATQERTVMKHNVRERRHATQRLKQKKQAEENERDKRIYQQQQHIFQLQIERLAQQADAETAREEEQRAVEQRECDERWQRVQAALEAKKREWERLTGKAEVEQHWLHEWTELITSDQSTSTIESSGGDRLHAAIATTTPAPSSAATTAQPTVSSPRQPLPSPSAKKGKKDDTVPPPPPPPSLAALLASHPTAFTTHIECRQLASTFHTAPSSSAELAGFLSSAHSTPLFPSFLQHIHRTAAGPPLPCLPLHLPAFRHIISVVGAPFSGKRTQSRRLAQHLNLHLVDIHGTLASPDPPAAVKERLLAGTPIDDPLLVQLVCDQLRSVDVGAFDGVLLLDFPTTLSQAHLLCSCLTGILPVETETQTTTRTRVPQPAIDASPVPAPVVPAGGGLTAVVELQCDARTRRSRCAGRCVDTSGVEWHREYNEMEWEQLGKEALTSIDDGATLEQHTREWERQRTTLVDWWQQCDNKISVDGEGNRDDVATRLQTALGGMLARPPAEAAAVEASVFEPLSDLQLAGMLSSQVRRYQAAYVEACKLYVRNMRGLRLSAEERNATIRECVARLARSESATLDIWREEEEREEAETVGLDADEAVSRYQDGSEKDEQHLRIDDMSARMAAALAARHSQWRSELSAFGSDGWVERMKRRLTAASVRQLQAELDRWVCEARVVRDYEAGSGAVLSEDDRGEKRYELMWPKGRTPPPEEKKDDKPAAGKADKAKGKVAAPTEEMRSEVDVWIGMRQQLTALLALWQPADDATRDQSKQLMAALEAALWQRVERVEAAGQQAIESVESDVRALMSHLVEFIKSRVAAEEEEMRAVCRYARRRVEAEEERCGQWLIRRPVVGEPSLLVDASKRVRPAKAMVSTSVWDAQKTTQQAVNGAVEQDSAQQSEEVKTADSDVAAEAAAESLTPE